MAFKIARFLDIADGLQANQFSIGSRDPSIDERRVLFECPIDRIATFGKP